VNPGDVVAVPPTAVAKKRAVSDLRGTQAKPEEISAVPPVGGGGHYLVLNSNNISSAVSHEADRSQQWDY
jgi:hypothetical protein